LATATGRGMTAVLEAGRLGHVLELPRSVVEEEGVPAPDRRHEEVRIAVVVDVGERRGHAHGIPHGHAGLIRDVLELALAVVAPELIASDLIGEVEVQETVAVHVGDGDAVAVVVVHRFVALAHVVHAAVHEVDSALVPPVGKPEVTEGRIRLRGLDLGRGARIEPRASGEGWIGDQRGRGLCEYRLERDRQLLHPLVRLAVEVPTYEAAAIHEDEHRAVGDRHLLVLRILAGRKHEPVHTQLPDGAARAREEVPGRAVDAALLGVGAEDLHRVVLRVHAESNEVQIAPRGMLLAGLLQGEQPLRLHRARPAAAREHEVADPDTTQQLFAPQAFTALISELEPRGAAKDTNAARGRTAGRSAGSRARVSVAGRGLRLVVPAADCRTGQEQREQDRGCPRVGRSLHDDSPRRRPHVSGPSSAMRSRSPLAIRRSALPGALDACSRTSGRRAVRAARLRLRRTRARTRAPARRSP